MNPSDMRADLRKTFPMLLRWARAIELVRELGGSERTWRQLVAHHKVRKHVVPGSVRAFYFRDAIMDELLPAVTHKEKETEQ